MASKEWQLTHEAAVRYEEILVANILGPFAKALVDWATIEESSTVIDVGCGTGAAARFAASKAGKVIGVDVNTEMLNVAQSLPEVDGAPIEWRRESAYDLSSADDSADVVLCAQTLQFLKEPVNALTEMRRVAKPGGAVYISLWTDIEQSPYFAALVRAVAHHISEDTAAGLGSAFNLTELDTILAHCASSGFEGPAASVAEITLLLPPLQEFVPKHIRATPMGIAYDAAEPATQQAIVDELVDKLAAYETSTGAAIPFRSHLVRAVK
ncbi:MAG: class I SAM-dependent methyltransferase [Chloroflexi bacterium]|nr:class I SAM-dependent methyltransferase [Chloroflexota bacterium]